MKEALITKLIGGLYTFKDLTTNISYEGYARGKFRKLRVEADSTFNRNITMSSKKDVKDIVLSPKVGDIINYKFTSDQYIITDIKPRRNELTRPDVANVDQILLVFSATRPEFSFKLLDKFLVILEKNHLKPVILVSKIDLVSGQELDNLKDILRHYEKYYDIYYANSKDKIGIDVLKDIFKDKITVLAGQTGVGKSTLLNALIPELSLKTQDISESLGRGKHTTRHLEIFEFNNGYIADTPGFSRLDLEFHEFEEIKDYFSDFKELAKDCKFGYNCNHVNEPDCRVKEVVKTDNYLKSRYESYLEFVTEIKNQKQRY